MVICQLMVAKALFEDFVLCIQIIPLPYIRYNENLSNNPIFFGCPCGVGFCGLPVRLQFPDVPRYAAVRSA